MSVVLYNPTNEFMRMTFAGRSFPMVPDAKVKVSDSCGKHLLNQYTARGLCSLDFGDQDNIGKIRDEGRARNRAFKIRCIDDHNQKNVERKGSGLPYLHPTKQLLQYAKELEVGLLEPYRIDDASAAIKKENEDLKSRLDRLEGLLIKLVGKESVSEEEIRDNERSDAEETAARTEAELLEEEKSEISAIFKEEEDKNALYDEEIVIGKKSTKKKPTKKGKK